MDVGSYIITSGGDTTMYPASNAGKPRLALLKKHLDKLRTVKRSLNNDIVKCVREIVGFCLRSGALKYMMVKKCHKNGNIELSMGVSNVFQINR